MARNPNRLLIIDDEPSIRDFISEVARELGFEVLSTGDPDEFRDAMKSFDPAVVILDLHMPRVDGIELLRFLGTQNCTAAVMLASGMDQRVLAAAEQLGYSQGLAMMGTLPKPILLPELQASLSAVYEAPSHITEDGIAEGIEQEQFEVFYQPKAALQQSGHWTIRGAEALVRWHHPDLGLVFPDEFIPLAESSALIEPLTNFVLRSAIDQIRIWQGSGMNMNVSVNLSPQMATDLDIPNRLSRLLADHRVDGSLLTVEITETAAIADPETTTHILTRLRLKNIGLSMDDFGTGFSSLTQLYQLPFTELKIDKSLVFDVPRSAEAMTVVRSLIELAHSLGLTVCAEGVETREALDFLAGQKCDAAQGYYFARPDTAEATEKFIRNWNGDAGHAALAK